MANNLCKYTINNKQSIKNMDNKLICRINNYYKHTKTILTLRVQNIKILKSNFMKSQIIQNKAE